MAASAMAQSVPGFSIGSMDTTANPCVDFYQYACGTWMAKHPVPADQSRWGVMEELTQHNLATLQNILEKSAANSAKRTATEQKIGDFYSSCMDQQAIDKMGLRALQPEFNRINAIATKSALVDELIRLHTVGVNAFFNFSAAPDQMNSSIVIGQADQGGLGLPEKDYYLKDDAKSVQLRKQYVAHLQKMMELAGEATPKATDDARMIMQIETDLAKGSQDIVARSDPNQTYHKLTVHELFSLCPAIDWPKYFAGAGAPAMNDLNVVYPTFFRTVESVIVQTDLEDLKTYLRWHLVHAEVPFLPTALGDENFRFFGQILTGAKEMKPRWKRCVEAVDNDLGFALGEKYVEVAFGPDGKARTLQMVQEIEKALGDDLHTLTWMTPATREQALVKLKAVQNKIGYPDKWRDYSSVQIMRGDAVGNDMRATEFEVHRVLGKIGKPVDRSEFYMTPPTVNAYYNPGENNINFPAGILQPPYFDKKMDAPVNYGGGASVVGHELTHGFDDQGRQFDAQGNLKDWWTPQDAAEFQKRADCFVQEYSSFVAIDDVHLNGKLTLGENAADNGGLRLAFMALMDTLKDKPQPKIDGFTPEQRFFLGWGQVWCQNVTPEAARMRAQVDPHSPGRFRVIGVIQNMPEFQQAFSCKVGDPMVRTPACRIW